MHEFLCGIIIGLTQTIIGHPFDTMKVWYQNKVQYNQPKLNYKNLYKGLKIPLLQNPLIIGTTLYTNNRLYNYSNNIYISSFCSGLASSILYTPFDYYKINIQQQQDVFLKNSYKKIHIVTIHEVPANMIFFISYFKFKEMQINNHISGGISGLICTLFVYPINTIKTRMQTNINISLKECISKGKLYSGIQFSICRSIVCGIFGLPLFDKIKNI